MKQLSVSHAIASGTSVAAKDGVCDGGRSGPQRLGFRAAVLVLMAMFAPKLSTATEPIYTPGPTGEYGWYDLEFKHSDGSMMTRLLLNMYEGKLDRVVFVPPRRVEGEWKVDGDTISAELQIWHQRSNHPAKRPWPLTLTFTRNGREVQGTYSGQWAWERKEVKGTITGIYRDEATMQKEEALPGGCELALLYGPEADLHVGTELAPDSGRSEPGADGLEKLRLRQHRRRCGTCRTLHGTSRFRPAVRVRWW